MQVCPICQLRNPDTHAGRVSRNALLQNDPEEIRKACRAADRKREPAALLAAQGFLEQRVRRSWLGRLWATDREYDMPHRFPFTAATLSLLPGLGQAYNRQYAK